MPHAIHLGLALLVVGPMLSTIASGQDPASAAADTHERTRRLLALAEDYHARAKAEERKHSEQELREYIDLLGFLVGRQQQAQVFDQLAQGTALESEGRYLEAERCYNSAVSLARRTNAAAPLQAACRLNWLRVGQIACGDAYSSVRNGMEPLIAELQQGFGPGSSEVAEACEVHGRHLLESNQREERQAAREKLEKCLNIRQAALAVSDPRIARAQYLLGFWNYDQGAYGEAERLYRRGIEIYEQSTPPPLEAADALCALGELLLERGDLKQAGEVFSRAEAVCKAREALEHPFTARLHAAQARLKVELFQFDEAWPLFDRAVQILQGKVGTRLRLAIEIRRGEARLANGDLPLADAILSEALKPQHGGFSGHELICLQGKVALGEYWLRVGQPGRAVKQWEAIDEQLSELNGDASHPLLARIWEDYARAMLTVRDFRTTAANYMRSLQLYEQTLGESAVRLRTVLLGLAELHSQHLKRWNDAAPLYERCLQITGQAYGEESYPMALVRSSLGEAHIAGRRWSDAKTELERAERILLDKASPLDPALQTCRGRLAAVHFAQGRAKEGVAAIDAALRATRDYVGTLLPLLGQQEQIKFIRGSESRGLVMRGLSRAVHHPDEKLLRQAAEWHLNFKSMLLESLTQRTMLARESQTPEIHGLFEEMLNGQAAMALYGQRWLNAPKDQRSALEYDVVDAMLRVMSTSHRLGHATQELAGDAVWSTLDDVQAALPEGAVLIDFARTPLETFGAEGRQVEPDHYLAWVIPAKKTGVVRLVDLGAAADIDAAVRQFRAANEGSGGGSERTEEAAVKESLKILSQRLLKPLMRDIGQAEHWIISPDSQLWLLPFSALLLDDGSYVLEKHIVSNVVTGRELLKRHKNGPVSQALILAAPDYDDGGKQTDLLGRLSPLPGTLDEAKRIAPHLKQATGVEPLVLTKSQATERLAKSATRPCVIVLSTHGMFESANLIENPLLQCGLALAGGNDPNRSRYRFDDDGMLTGLEILEMDLRGTRLAVLSACETGLGRIAAGEGVAGLQQAFLEAGARGVMSTLWSIPDRETAELMGDLFKRLSAGEGAAQALRSAQLAMIKSRRGMHGAAHPMYWAAFTINGDWNVDLKTDLEISPLPGERLVDVHHWEVDDKPYTLALSHDGKKASAGGVTADLYVWDVEKGTQLGKIKLANSPLDGALFLDERRLLAAPSGNLTIVDRRTGTAVIFLERDSQETSFWSHALAKQGKSLLVGTQDGRLAEVDMATKGVTHRGESADKSIRRVIPSPDGKQALGCLSPSLGIRPEFDAAVIWDLDTGKIVARYDVQGPVAVSSDWQFAVSSKDGVLQIWELATGKTIRTLPGHGGNINGVAMTADDRLLITASADQTIRLWEVETGRQVQVIRQNQASYSLAISREGGYVLSSSYSPTTHNTVSVRRIVGAKP